MTEKEKLIVEKYNKSFNPNEKWFIFMNDGFCPLDDNEYPKDFDDIFLTEKYQMWKYQVYLYKVLLETIGIHHNDNSSLGKTLLDIGCGRGGGISFYNDYYKFEKLIGIDLNSNHINFANEYINGVKFFCASSTNIPIESNSLDFITAVETCEYYEPFEDFVREVYRVLKPNGIFVRAGRGIFDKKIFLKNGFEKVNYLNIDRNVRMSCSISKWRFFEKSFEATKILYSDETLFLERKFPYNIMSLKK